MSLKILSAFTLTPESVSLSLHYLYISVGQLDVCAEYEHNYIIT